MCQKKRKMVSVLMGVYNEKDRSHVMQAIDSVLGQTYSDFELIICDDGSDRAFYGWLKKYCQKDDRIKLIRSEINCGLAAALNRCFSCAEGEYIARMDADDISKPKRLEKQIEFLEKHPRYALAGCNAELIDDRGVWGRRVLPSEPQSSDFLRTSPFIHPSVVMRRAVMKKLGGYSTAKYARRTEDYEMFMRMYAEGLSGYNLQEMLFCYREDRSALAKRSYRYRINETMVRYRGFRQLGILKGNIHYVIKPLVVGMIPACIMQKIRKRKFGVCE